jgi:tetratricopeptide (TPR) repeat protein
MAKEENMNSENKKRRRKKKDAQAPVAPKNQGKPGSEESKKIASEIFRKAYDAQMAGRPEEAIELYQQSIAMFPTPEAHTFLGWVYSFQHRYDEAIEECRKALKLDPDFGNPYNDIGAYLIEKGSFEEAVPWLKKAISAKRYDSYCYPHYNLGRIFERKGAWFEALRYYQNSLEANPEYSLARKSFNRLRGVLN